MTQDIMATVAKSRARMLAVLHDLHAERGPGCTTWEQWTIPAVNGTMLVEGCRKHDIIISVR